jgi:hypothetical protein
MSAALLQGARGVTEGVDLWFEQLNDPRIAEAARAANGFWISGAFGMRPPGLGGFGLEDRFDVVLTADGLGDVATEYAGAAPFSWMALSFVFFRWRASWLASKPPTA